MAEYKKLTEVELIETPSEGATVLAEENGQLKRVPYEKVGGGGGIPTAIIKSSDYDDLLAMLVSPPTPIAAEASMAAPSVTYTCTNMTFEEAYALLESGQPLQAVAMIAQEAAFILPGSVGFFGLIPGVPLIGIVLNITDNEELILYWTADGLSTDAPNQEK